MIILTLFGCSSGGGDDTGFDPDTILPPEVAILITPEKDEECNQGNIVSDTQSMVSFQWNASANTVSYTHILKNLDTDVESEENTTSTSITLTIARNVPYSWKVISKSNKTTSTATSETWKFYNAGEGVDNYAPFPADLVAPTMGSKVPSPVTLSWNGSDIDDDIVSYDVYIDTANPPTTLLENTTNSSIYNISLNADTVYYWRVITIDQRGSNSQSPVFEFRTE
jgi:hypothetical protein